MLFLTLLYLVSPSGLRVQCRVDRHRVYNIYLPSSIIREYRLSTTSINDVTSNIYSTIRARSTFVQLSSIVVLGNLILPLQTLYQASR